MYSKEAVMTGAWELFRKRHELEFSECLHRAWISEKARPVNAQRIADAKAAAGIEEDTATWSGWKEQGFEVVRGDNAEYKARFFGRSQVQPVV